MKQIKIVLPDAVYIAAEREAKALDIDASTYCANLLIDSLISGQTNPPPKKPSDPAPKVAPPQFVGSSGLSNSGPAVGVPTPPDFASVFRGYPERSRRYAKAIYDEAMKIPGVVAKLNPDKGQKSVMFEPNFLVIEYLLSKGTRAGIGISLGANKSKYKNAPKELKDGRTESYSRILIESDDVLTESLPLIRETYDLRYNP